MSYKEKGKKKGDVFFINLYYFGLFQTKPESRNCYYCSLALLFILVQRKTNLSHCMVYTIDHHIQAFNMRDKMELKRLRKMCNQCEL